VQQGAEEYSEFSRMPRFCVNGVALRFEDGGDSNVREIAQSESSDSA
jgi:peptide methionine sulfoxide reductase MsrB